MCLATNIYHEARGESFAGKLAVGLVTMNRVASPHHPDDVCGVVHEGKYWNNIPIKNKCQFSWWCDGKSDKPTDEKAWSESLDIAMRLLSEKPLDFTDGATHYHSIQVEPYWADTMRVTMRIDNHIFYK